MNKTKRIVITTVLGLISGAIAVGLVSLGSGGFPPEINLRMLISFGFMGFVIGISSLRWHWALNGMVIGAMVGLIEGLAGFAVIGLLNLLIIPLIFTTISGFLIELITTVGFKAGVASPQIAPQFG